MDTNLEFTELPSDSDTAILRLKGPLVIQNVFEFQSSIRAIRTPKLVLEMTEVPYIDSSAVGVLVGAHVNRDKEGRSLLLVGVNDRVRNILKVTNVEQFFKFSDSLAEGSASA
jgi:anti-sigma B factor antagonist